MKRGVLQFVFTVLFASGTLAGVKFNSGAEASQDNVTARHNVAAGRDNSIQCHNERFAGGGEAKVCSSIPLHGIEGNGMNSGFSTIDDAVLAAAQSAQNKQCQIRRDPDPNDVWDTDVGVEIHINGYERDGKYFYGDSYWFEDKHLAGKNAPHKADDFSSSNLKHAFSFHNHPNTKIANGNLQARSDTFSEADIKSAVGDGVPSYMMPCYLDGGGTVPRLLRFDPATGVVSARAVAMDKNGKVRYTGEWYKDVDETNRAKVVDRADKEIGVKIPDLSKLIDAMRRMAECLRKINAMSSKPSEEDYAEYNKLMDKFAEEAEKVEKVLEDEIGKMKTEDEQVKFSKQLGDLFDRQYGGSKLCNEILSLKKQIQAKGYGRFAPRNLNFNVMNLK